MANVSRIIEDLREAARYTHTDVVECRRIVKDCADRSLGHPSPWPDRLFDLMQNLDVATHYMQVEPDVAKGYILGAAFELEAMEMNKR